mgnify:CR=1 FL=1
MAAFTAAISASVSVANRLMATTGATLRACRAALRRAGATAVGNPARIIVTGDTFDKHYDAVKGELAKILEPERLRAEGKADADALRAAGVTTRYYDGLGLIHGYFGLGEASDAFGIYATTPENVAAMRAEIDRQFAILRHRSPFDVELFRQSATLPSLLARTVHSALEQAMWDMAGKALDVPVDALLGGKVSDTHPVYANINRTAKPRTPAGFAATAKRAEREAGIPDDPDPALIRRAAIDVAPRTNGVQRHGKTLWLRLGACAIDNRRQLKRQQAVVER